MVKLKLLDLRCLKTEEVGSDEAYLKVRNNKVWSTDGIKAGAVVSLRSIQPISFSGEIEVTLMEKDSFRDDLLGQGTVTADQAGQGQQEFDWREAGAHYQLIYEVIPA